MATMSITEARINMPTSPSKVQVEAALKRANELYTEFITYARDYPHDSITIDEMQDAYLAADDYTQLIKRANHDQDVYSTILTALSSNKRVSATWKNHIVEITRHFERGRFQAKSIEGKAIFTKYSAQAGDSMDTCGSVHVGWLSNVEVSNAC